MITILILKKMIFGCKWWGTDTRLHRAVDRLVPSDALKRSGGRRGGVSVRNTQGGIFYSYTSEIFDCCTVCLLLACSCFILPFFIAVFFFLVVILTDMTACCSILGFWCKSPRNIQESFTCGECIGAGWDGKFSYRNANSIYCYSLIFTLLGICTLPCAYGLLFLLVAVFLRIVLTVYSCIFAFEVWTCCTCPHNNNNNHEEMEDVKDVEMNVPQTFSNPIPSDPFLQNDPSIVNNTIDQLD